MIGKESRLMDNVTMKHYSPGNVIFLEGDVADGVYLVLSGAVEVSQKKGPRKIILATQGKNTIFGEMALLDNRPRSATVKAVEDTYCYCLKASDFIKKLLRVDPTVRDVLQELALIIRINNKENAGDLPLPDWMEESRANKGIRTQEQIAGDAKLQEKIGELDPFMKGVYRVLTGMAFQ